MRFLRNASGAAAVEFSLIAPILAMVLIGLGAGGGTILAYNKARQAVSSGAQYAMTGGTDIAAVQAIVLEAWPTKPADAEVQVDQQCFCGAASNACTTNCASDGDYPVRMTIITATGTYNGLMGAVNLSATQRVRTR